MPQPRSSSKTPPSSIRTPLYDDANHVAYGWQQMSQIPDFPGMFALVTPRRGSPEGHGPGSSGGENIVEGEKNREMGRRVGTGISKCSGDRRRTFVDGDMSTLVEESASLVERAVVNGRDTQLDLQSRPDWLRDMCAGESNGRGVAGQKKDDWHEVLTRHGASESTQRDDFVQESASLARLSSKSAYSCPPAGQSELEPGYAEKHAANGEAGPDQESIEVVGDLMNCSVSDDADDMATLTAVLSDWHIHVPSSEAPTHSRRMGAVPEPQDIATVKQTEYRPEGSLCSLDAAVHFPGWNVLARESADVLVTSREPDFEVIGKPGGCETARNGAGPGGKWGMMFRCT